MGCRPTVFRAGHDNLVRYLSTFELVVAGVTDVAQNTLETLVLFACYIFLKYFSINFFLLSIFFFFSLLCRFEKCLYYGTRSACLFVGPVHPLGKQAALKQAVRVLLRGGCVG